MSGYIKQRENVGGKVITGEVSVERWAGEGIKDSRESPGSYVPEMA